jgi:hypothetical protein
MAEMNAVVGYVPDATAEVIGSERQYAEPLEIRLEREGEVHVRISPDDVAGVLMGASQKGETGVQVLLKDKATVETFTRGSADSFLKPIHDLNLWPWRPPIVVIYIDPQNWKDLVRLNRESIEARDA